MVAIPISFTIATRIPIMKTSIMLQGWTWRSNRNACGSCQGTRPRWSGSRTQSSSPIWHSGASTIVKKTSTAIVSRPCW